MKSKKWLSILLTAIVMAGSLLAFSGCSKDSDSGEKTEPKNTTEVTEGKKDEEQYLKTILFDPQTFDPNECQDTSSHTILAATQEGLVRAKVVDGKDVLEPAAAENWSVSDDGLVYTFKIRDMKWSDGVKFTAQHFVDSYRRILDKNNAFPYAYFLYDIKGAEAYNKGTGKVEDVGVEAKDDNTLVITLERPTVYFEKKLVHSSFYPIRLDIIEKGGENWNTDYTKQVYSGPYKITDLIKNNSLVLEKNQDYWDAENVFIEKVEMNKIEEFSTQAQLFEAHELDVTGSTQEYIKKWTEMAEEGKFQAATGEAPGNWYFGLNVKGGPSGIMSNNKIRQAVSLSIDREDYVNTLSGRFTPAYAFVPKAIDIGEDNYREKATESLKEMSDEYKNNPEKLQALFKEGLKELGKDINDLSQIKLKYLARGTSTASKQEHEWYQQQLEKNLGVKVNVEVAPDYGIWKKAVLDSDYDISFFGWSADFNDPINFLDQFETNNGNNDIKFSNAEYDKICRELLTETDQNKRLEKLQKLEDILIKDEAAVSPLYYTDTRRFTQNYIKNFMTPKFGPDYEWRWAYTEGRN
ncbi:peptide ABC transporter substrate-binding protein [Clostridium sp. Marseille-Q7071]